MSIPNNPYPSDQELISAAVHGAATNLLPGRLPTLGHALVIDADTTIGDVISVDRPRELFVLGLDRILDGSGLDGAVAAGWRSLVHLAGRPVAIADSRLIGGEATVHSMNYGPFVAGLAAIEPVDPAVGTDSGGPTTERILEVPALFFVGIWRHSTDRDLVIPAAPAPDGLDAGRALAAGELIARLAPVARARLSANDRGAQ